MSAQITASKDNEPQTPPKKGLDSPSCVGLEVDEVLSSFSCPSVSGGPLNVKRYKRWLIDTGIYVWYEVGWCQELEMLWAFVLGVQVEMD